MRFITALPADCGLEITDLACADDGAIVLQVAPTRTAVPCPVCGVPATRVHSHYARTVADLPWQGQPVRFHVQTRRFFCDNAGCPRRIFTERFPGLLTVAARRTVRLQLLYDAVGLALGGEAGARLIAAMGLGVSSDTLLRGVRALPLPAVPTPRVLGVDDFARRRGRTYGTVLIDLERRRVVDLLPDRSADTLAAWLQDHPGVEIVSRDRAEAYAEGARRGAPGALQVADRFHLVKNLGDALLQALISHRTTLAQVGWSPPGTAEARGDGTGSPRPAHGAPVGPSPRADPVRRAQRLARYEQAVALRARGWTHAAIAREVGVCPRTLVRWLAANTFPERKPRRRPPHPFGPYAAYLTDRWAEGCHNATQLWREVCAQGYDGPRYRIFEVAQRLRRGDAAIPDPDEVAAGAVPKSPPLTPRRVAGMVLRRADDRTPEEQRLLAAVCAVDVAVERAVRVSEQFLTLVRERQVAGLQTWLTEATTCGVTDLERFASGLTRDLDAVRAGLSLPYSNGQTEGQVTRLKLVKRSMYGRGRLDLLRRRLVRAA